MTRTGSVLEDVDYEDIINESRDKTGTCFLIDGEEVWLTNENIDIDEDRKVITMPKWYAARKGISKLS